MEEEKIEFSKRVTRPGHYTLMIKSFTLLYGILQRTPDVESFESPAFEVSGHKWKLSFYPNGNKKLGGDDDHISLYLVTADDAIDTVGSEINAVFKLFIMDQLQDGEVRRFHGMKKMWGFTKLIPLCTFKDAKSGYLVDDCCVFGVEILVIAPEVKSSFFSLVEMPLGGTFTWKVDNFFKCSDLSHSSEEFTVEGFQWTLSVHKHGEYLSFYLVPSDTPYQSRIFVECDLILKNSLGDDHIRKKMERWFDGVGYGFSKFTRLSDLKDNLKGFLVNDCAIFEVVMDVISSFRPVVDVSVDAFFYQRGNR